MPEVLTPEIVPAEQEAKIALESAMQVVTRAKAVVVKSDDDYRAADSACAAIKFEIKKVEARRDELVRPLNTVVKKINAGFKDVTAALEQALDAYRRPMTTYQAELARLRLEAETAARKERDRLEAEARAKADAEIAAAKKAREDADAAHAAAEGGDPFAAVLAEQDAAEAEERAQAQAEAARKALRDMAAINIEAVATPKVTGAASKTFTVWDFEITDPALVPMAYRPIDLAALARDVKAGKDQCQIPGVRVFSRVVVK
jgi:chromosome segregation ATPase